MFDQNNQACLSPLGFVPSAACPGEGMSSELPSPCSQVNPKRADSWGPSTDHTLYLGRKSFLHGHLWFPSSYLSHMRNPFIGFFASALVCGPLIMVCLLHGTVSSLRRRLRVILLTSSIECVTGMQGKIINTFLLSFNFWSYF